MRRPASILMRRSLRRRRHMPERRDQDRATSPTYDVGYSKPPKETQFVKGQSGNKKGRPKGSKNLGTILYEAGRQLVDVTEKGRTRKISKLEVIVIKLINL